MSDSLLRVKLEPDLRIWTPQGLVDPKIAGARAEVERYDERLMLARHELTGDWCVFLKKGPFGDPYPVLGLGRELPPRDEIRRRLEAADTARHGDRMLREMNAANDRIRAEKDRLASEGSGIAAEALEWGFRKQGAHPSPRIFVPRSA